MKPLYKLTKEYHGVPYKLGSSNFKEGLDCMTAFRYFLQETGYDLSKWDNDDFYIEYNGMKINRNNYKDLIPNTQDLQKVFYKFIKENFTKQSKLKCGCLCIVKTKKQILIMLYLGQNKFLRVFENYGVKIMTVRSELIQEIYS